MLTHDSIGEAEWTAYLAEHLASAASAQPGPIAESDRPVGSAIVSRISAINTRPVAEVVTMPASVALKEQFRSQVIDRAVIAELSTTNLSKSKLAIQAKPEWTVSAQQVYRQTPPVPMLGEPIRAENFLLWADPQEDTVEVELPDKFAQLDPRVVKPLPAPILIDQRLHQLDRVVRPGLALNAISLDRVNKVDRVVRDKAVLVDALKVRNVKIPVRRAFFATVIPELQSFRLIVQQGQPGHPTLGTALLTVSLYSKDSAELLETHRLEWTDALSAAGYGSRVWKFLPVNLQKLQPFLDLDSQQLRSPVQITVNPGAGTATFLLELSAIGTQVWQQALERRQPEQIAGIARFTANFYARTDDRLQIRAQNFSTSLASLLQRCGSEHIEVLSPTLALTTSLISQSHAFVESVTATWDIDPQPRIFPGTEESVLTGIVLTDRLESVEINWKARVKYRFPGWSLGLQQGKLSLRTPIAIVKPGSSEWLREYTIYTVMMASPTQVATNLAEFEDIEIEAVLTFNASYLALPLSTTFKPRHLEVTEVPFPILPGQKPNQVGITIVSRSKSSDRVLASPPPRILPTEALLLNLKVFRDGTVEVVSNTDPILESAIDGELFDLIRQLN